MSDLFPHTPYTEDQPLSKTILTTHVLRSGATAGAILSLPISAALLLFTKPPASATPTAPLAARLPRMLLTASARGTLVGTALSGAMLAARMNGRERIEWQDRAWRLRENRGQTEADWWLLGGGTAGALAGWARRASVGSRVGTAVVGGTGLGLVVGTVGYLGWRYGVKGGWKEELVV